MSEALAQVDFPSSRQLSSPQLPAWECTVSRDQSHLDMLKSAWILEEIVLKTASSDSVPHIKINGLVLDLARVSLISLQCVSTLTCGLCGHSRFTEIFLQADTDPQYRHHRKAKYFSNMILRSSRVLNNLWKHGNRYPKQWMTPTRLIAGLLWILVTVDGSRRISSIERKWSLDVHTVKFTAEQKRIVSSTRNWVIERIDSNHSVILTCWYFGRRLGRTISSCRCAIIGVP